jgi:F-type H+-transporting ATPase subunit delta
MQTVKQTQRAARRLFRLCVANRSLDEPRARQVVRQMIDAGGGTRRLSVLSRFLRLVRIERAQHCARVESAVPLPFDLRTRIEAGLADIYGRGIVTSFEEDPGLIGGVRISVGSDVYDGTLKGGLAALEAVF